MALTALEIIALLFALSGLIKFAIITFDKKRWLKTVSYFYKNPSLPAAVLVVIAIILFIFLIRELSIIQIFAAMAFTSVLIGLGFLQYGEDFSSFAKSIFKKQTTSTEILYAIFWLLLFVWVLIEIFT